MAAKKPSPQRPFAVKVGHLDFTVEWLPEKEWKKRELDDEDGGSMSGYEALICMRLPDDKINEGVLKEVLLHEIMHACFFVSGLSYEKVHRFEDVEEAFIMRCAPVLLQVLRDNAHLVEYLTHA
jgi:hypothetical protein